MACIGLRVVSLVLARVSTGPPGSPIDPAHSSTFPPCLLALKSCGKMGKMLLLAITAAYAAVVR